MTSHQVESRNRGRNSHLPGGVYLHLCHTFQSRSSGISPISYRPRTRTYRRHRVLVDSRLYTSSIDRFRPLADRHKATTLWQIFDNLLTLVIRPFPIPHYNLSLGCCRVNSLLDSSVYRRLQLCIRPLAATRTLFVELMARCADRIVLRCRNREYSTKSLDLRKYAVQ